MSDQESRHAIRGAEPVSRRAFLERSTALGITATLAGSMVGRAAWAAQPKKGGRLVAGVAHGATTDSLDPATYENNYTVGLANGIHNFLTEIDANGQLVPELAESWEASDDAKQWTFKLRKGVEFQNGKSVSADDVVASINHHRGEDTKSGAKPIVAGIEDIKTDGGQTVTFKLSEGNADFAFIMSDIHLPIVPANSDGTIDWRSGIGTGGYLLESFEPGVRATLKRNPNYWKEGRAHFDAVELLSIVDTTARSNALATGEIHVMDRCDLKTVHLLKRNKDLRVEEVTGTLHYTFPMRTDIAPFDNNDVRLALKYAIDREEMVQKILRGHGVVGNDHPIGPANRFFGDGLEQRAYDPDKAKFHLKKAGAEGLTVDLSAADAAFGGAVDAAALYKERAAKAGININVVREPNDGYWSNVWLKKPWCACYWSGRPTEDWMFSTAYEAGADWNDTYWNNGRFNALLVEARAELDQAKRRDMYIEMQKLVRDDGGAVIPMFANYVFAVSNQVQHDAAMSGNWDLDGERFMERWWFA
ncbi:MAG: ABC transporter substrate-binding protein [Pseudomonadota bacterium]